MRSKLIGALMSIGQSARGETVYEETLGLAREIGNPAQIGNVLLNWAGCELDRLDSPDSSDRAAALAEEALQLAEGHQIGTGISWAKALLAVVAQGHGHIDQAGTLAAESLRLIRDERFLPIWTPACLAILAWVAAGMQQPLRAARLVGAHERICGRMGIGATVGLQSVLADDLLAHARMEVGAAVWAEAYTAGQALSTEQAIAEALEESGHG